ncbi:MAG TPA: anti-sigma factor [Candidatus Limnocylindrales bacterium]|nr:anti-sigma factor [Candidatus Limnocylindrales bacterium]
MTDRRLPGGQPGGLTCDAVRDIAASFVLDALPEAEMAAVREHLATCPEPHPEIAELASVVPVLHAAVRPAEPPAALKDRIMAAAAADLEARDRESDVEDMLARPETAGAARTAPGARPISSAAGRQPRWSWALGIAAVLAIVLLGGWNLSLRSQLDDAQAYQRAVAAVLDTARQPGALTAVMAAPSGEGPTGFAAVSQDGQMRIAMRQLAPTTGDEVYEAWMIEGTDAPVALGGFRVGADGAGYLEATGVPPQGGLVLALTREPRAGMTAPSSDPVSVGTATPPASA